MPDRRTFLKYTAASLILPMTPVSAKQRDRKVLVIGAGLSGLRAAMLLQDLGIESQVIEARERVGGRLFTLDHLPGHPEGGGNTIGPNYGRIIDTAKRLSVDLYTPPRPLPSGYFINGQRISRQDWTDSELNPLPESLRKLTPDRIVGALLRNNPLKSTSDWRHRMLHDSDLSASEFFAGHGLSPEALQLVDVNNSYGNTLSGTSLLPLYRVMRSFSRAMTMKQPTFEAVDGNMRIPEQMAASLENPVVLGQTVKSINSADGAMSVKAASGDEHLGDVVILAIPATAARKITFSPGLPREQQLALDAVHYHKIIQAHLVVKEPYWSGKQFAGYWTNGPLGRIFVRPIPGSELATITIWINGDGCDQFDRLPRDLAKTKIMEEFFATIPEAKGKVEFGELVSWANDPFAEGSWIIWRPGDIPKYADLLHQPAGRILFAGEHTGYAGAGMEAAMESADRVVLEAIRAMS